MSGDFGSSEFTDAQTMRGRDWPGLRQFCVFLENRVGRLQDLLRQVETPETRVIAVTIVDSVDFAMTRLIFRNADRAREKLELSGFLFSESDVLAVELPDDGDKPLTSICTELVRAEINIHHTYPLLWRRRGCGAVALYVDDLDRGAQVLREAGYSVLNEDDLQEDDNDL